MYRLLLVDDEEIIVNGLFEIFRSLKHLDLDVYKAYSGNEAIEWLNRTRIDIVLTDIRMPGIDGLQLLDMIYRSWPQCKVIFLTGYDEFDYVYKAIQHSGVSYILKTEDHEKVINAVENAIKEIEKGIKIEDLIHKAKEQMNMALGLFQKDYLLHLLQGESFTAVSKPQFEQFGIPMIPDQPVILLVGHVDNMPADMSYWDRLQYLYSIRLIVERHLLVNIRSVNVIDGNNNLVLFLQPKEPPYEKMVSFLKGAIEIVQTACRESLNASISFALGGEPCSWDAVSEKYYSLNQLLNYRIGTGIEILLIDNEFRSDILSSDSTAEPHILEVDSGLLEMQVRRKSLEALELYLESGQADKYFTVISELVEPIKGIKSKNNNLAIEMYYKVSLMLLSYINRWKLTERLAFYIGLNKLMRMDEHASWNDAVEYLYRLSEIIFNLQREEQGKRADHAIEFIQKYIQEHLHEDLSLVKLAEQVYLNPSYLSRLYKQVTGTNLSDFIDNARIKKAKELLGKENVKINEAAKQVGYDTAASFTRFFRKITGLSPQEYHDSLLKGKQMTTR